MKFRILEYTENSAYQNMSIDESIFEGLIEGKSEPTIRFYGWKPSAVSIGRFQSMGKEVNVAGCKRLGIDLTRRITGGGAVYHDNEGEVTYSVICPADYCGDGITESYRTICEWVIAGLAEIGIEASFAPINDIVLNGKKISGNAQTRKDGVLLQHGTILYKTDVRKMFSVLSVSKEKISDKMIKSVEERVTSTSNISRASKEELCSALLKGFCNGKETYTGKLTPLEEKRAKELEEKYKSEEWNFSR